MTHTIAIAEHHYIIHALAILPDHVHLIMAWHPRNVDEIAAHLKAKATMRLNKEGIHPLANDPKSSGQSPSPWARKHWCPFIGDEKHLRVAIRYVEANPLKARLPAQHWKLVTPYRAGSAIPQK